MARVGVRHANQTHLRHCLDNAARNTSMRTSGTHPGTFLREAHGMVPSKQLRLGGGLNKCKAISGRLI